jgi:hypothetical protein
VRDVIVDMRDDELRFSQALKERLTGTPMTDVFSRDGELPELGLPISQNLTVEVISEFGTARESTLAMLRGMPPEAWDDQSFGPATIRDAVNTLLANDAKHMEKIVNLLGSPAAT